MNCIWKMSYGTVVTAVFKMTIKNICPYFWASYDIPGDELLDVGNQPAPSCHFLHWQRRTYFLMPGEGLLLSPSPQSDVAPFVCFLPISITGAGSHCTLLMTWAVSHGILQCRIKTSSLCGMCWPKEGAPSLKKPRMTSGLWKCLCFCTL